MKTSIKEIKDKITPEVMSCEGVEGIGITEEQGKEVVVIYISSISKEVKQHIQNLLHDYPYKFENTTPFTAL